MNKAYLLIPLPLIAVVAIYLTIPKKLEVPNSTEKISYDSPTPTRSVVIPTPVELTASFEIITNGTRRIFSDPKYHNLSEDVYITAEDPNTIVVTRSGITWSDFFATLPMKLDKTCLTTGTGQVFCTGESGELKFYINDVEDPDTLDKVIADSDNLKVIYDLNNFR